MISKDRFQPFFNTLGGAFVSSALKPYIEKLFETFISCIDDPLFHSELASIQSDFIGRPTPLLYAENASRILGGAQIFLKLEGLANTGAHKINNAYGQGLLAKRMGKRKIITETGAGQHGIATACVCARLGLECTVFMGLKDCIRQQPNVYIMELFGAKVIPVTRGTQTLTDAVDAAFEHLESNFEDTYYLIGSALGPYPYPHIVREFQSVIGNEVKEQFTKRFSNNPSVLIACVGGGSNSIGFFNPFLENKDIHLIGVEGGGTGAANGDHAVRMSGSAKESVHQGYRSMFLCNDDGSLMPTASISAGLDYAGIGPELAALGKTGRIEFMFARDSEVIEAFKFFARHEGIIAAMESSHALAAAMKIAPELSPDQSIVINVSGRGDKDIFITAPRILGKNWEMFLIEEANRLKHSGLY
jgi:tryptophan synthase beta chain